MEPIYQYHDANHFLNELVYGSHAKRGLQTQLAKAMGCQAAYLSQVLKEKAELTDDQALRLTKYLGFSPLESEYFLTLIRLRRAASVELKKYLTKQLAGIAQTADEMRHRADATTVNLQEKILSTYFSSWIPATLHVATSSPNFQTVSALAHRFGLSEKKVEDVLQFLATAGFVERRDHKWCFSGGSIHLPKESVFHITQQVAHRHQVIRSIECRSGDDLHFSSVFTIDQEDFQKLKAQMRDWVQKTQKKIHASGTEEVYMFCLDMFCVV